MPIQSFRQTIGATQIFLAQITLITQIDSILLKCDTIFFCYPYSFFLLLFLFQFFPNYILVFYAT